MEKTTQENQLFLRQSLWYCLAISMTESLKIRSIFFRETIVFKIVLQMRIEERDSKKIIENAKRENLMVSSDNKYKIYDLENKTIEINFAYDGHRDEYERSISYFSSNNTEDKLYIDTLLMSFFSNSFLWVGSERLIPDKEMFMPKVKFDSIRERNFNIRHYIFYLKTFNYANFDRFLQILKSISKDILIKPKIDHKTVYVKVDVSYNGPITEIGEMGSGIKYLILILVKIFYHRPSLILIDEPELNLHYDLTMRLLEFIKNSSFQFILSSHSDVFINNLNLNQLLYTKSKNNFISNVSSVDRSAFQRIMIDLGYTESNYEKLKNLDYDIMILYEGLDEIETERKLIEALLKKTSISKELNSLRKKFVPLGGKKDKILHNILDGIYGFSFPFILVMDKDEDKDEDIQKILNIYKDRIHIWEKREIENYLIDIPALTNIINSESDKITEVQLANQIYSMSRELISKVAILRIIEKYKTSYFISSLKEIRKFVKNNRNKPEILIGHELANFILSNLVSVNKEKIENEYSETLHNIKEIWKSEYLYISPGKDLLRKIKNYVNNHYHLTFTEFDILERITSVDKDIENFGKKIIDICTHQITIKKPSQTRKLFHVGTWNAPILIGLTDLYKLFLIRPNLEFSWDNTIYEILIFENNQDFNVSIITTKIIPYDVQILGNLIYILCTKIEKEDDDEIEHDSLIIYDMESKEIIDSISLHYEEEEGKEGDPCCLAINKYDKKVYASLTYYEAGYSALLSIEKPYSEAHEIHEQEVGYFDLKLDETKGYLYGIFYENPEYFLHIYDTKDGSLLSSIQIEATTSSKLSILLDDHIIIQNPTNLIKLNVKDRKSNIVLQSPDFIQMELDHTLYNIYAIYYNRENGIHSIKKSTLNSPEDLDAIVASKYRISNLVVGIDAIHFILTIPKENETLQILQEVTLQ